VVSRLLFAALLLAGPAAAETCTWVRQSPRAEETGPCTVLWSDRGATVTLEPRRWDITLRRREGAWETVTMNGLEAIGYALGPLHVVWTTTDLNESLEVAP
jgi:hypothetical protein